jgi:radical SAM protein with 4Fe4S-binding SPASM domain
MVYDLSVPNGTLYVRRNGKSITSGNCDVFNAGAAKIAKGDGSTTGCGKTWAMAGDGNAFLQGDSTGNEYDKTEERYEMLKQVPGPYTEGEEDHGGCKGCKYWNVCQGGCPSAALDYDYRNRTRWCEAKYALYEQIERDMKALFPGLRTITEAPWDAPLADGAGGRGKNIQPFAGMHHGESEDPSVFGGQTDASPVWSAATDGLSFEETAEMYREYYPEETLTIDQDEGTIHSDTA